MNPTHPHDVLAVLADLAPDARATVPRFIDDGDRAVLPYDSVSMFESGALYVGGERDVAGYVRRMRRAITPFLAQAKLHEGEEILRVGWLWVTGRADGERVRFPLVSASVGTPGVLFAASGTLRLGDVELTDLITDPADRERLEADVEFGGGAVDGRGDDHLDPALLGRLTRLHRFATAAASAAGHATERLTAQRLESDELHVVAQVAIYLTAPVQGSTTIAATLRTWGRRHVMDTAFEALYTAEPSPHSEREARPVESSIVLSPAQAAVVDHSRDATVTVVSGPPGTGKTQTITAIALDHVEAGRSVLVAAPSVAAVDALVDLLTVTPGPDPVVFGSSERRTEVADRLGQGGGQLVGRSAVERAAAQHGTARDRYHELRDLTFELLDAERLAAGVDPLLDVRSRDIAPAWFDSDADLERASRLVQRAGAVDGVFAGWRRRRRIRATRLHAGARTDDMAALNRALHHARARRAAHRLHAEGGLDLTAVWDRLVRADAERRRLKGDWLSASTHAADRVDRRARATMAAVAGTLRSGRANRRRRLGELDGRTMTHALPLWVGTLRDIDDLLPRTPAMFDLVIIDEGSQVDQISAAPALLRARRAVIVGDPRQLRHVSFLADERVRGAVVSHGITDPAVSDRLDVRRLSAFDLGAATVATHFLDEHYRSAPHLIDFSARRFYGGALTIATRHPRNDRRDCISVHRVDGRDRDGVNESELGRVLHLVRTRGGRDASGVARSIGLITPFRKHADAIESAVLDEFSLSEIDELALRVGTVHGFQGCERDVMIISLGLDDAAAPGTRSFVADPNLFNVMITRARDEIVVVTSLEDGAPGLLGDYLRYGEQPPARPSAGEAHRLAHTLAADLARSGVATHLGYPVGTHTIDLVIGDGDRALGIVVGLHPDGAAAHVERHLALRRARWDVREIFETRWGDRVAELAVELALEAEHRRGAT